MSETAEKTKVHHGNNLLLLRKKKGEKQDAIANAYGCNQKRISQLENQETISDDVLAWFADFYGLKLEDIRDREIELTAAPMVINNTFNDSSTISGQNYIGQGNIINNPLEEIVRLTQEKDALLKEIIEKDQLREQHLLNMLEKLVGKK